MMGVREMELDQVKGILHETECGKLFFDGMGCSEPILTADQNGLIDNFFVYFVNRDAGTYSGPVARIGLYAERKTIAYIENSEDMPFSIAPSATIVVGNRSVLPEEYKRYVSLYARIREFAFNEQCSDEQRTLLSEYLDALLSVTKEAVFPLYKELAPSFFTWADTILA